MNTIWPKNTGKSWRLRIVNKITAPRAQPTIDNLQRRKNAKVQDQKIHVEIRDTGNNYTNFRTSKSFANNRSSEESCGTKTTNNAKEKGTFPNSTFCINSPVLVAKLNRNTLNQKIKPHTKQHVIKKDKYKYVQLTLHRNHVLTEPQKHLHDGYTYKLDIAYTNIAGKKHSKRNTKQENKSYNKLKRWTHEPISSLATRNTSPNCASSLATTRRDNQQRIKSAVKKVKKPEESSSPTPSLTKPDKSSNPFFGETCCSLFYIITSKSLWKPIQQIGQIPRIPYCCTNNDHAISIERKGKIRTYQRTVQRASAIMEHKLGQKWRKRVQARTWCNGRETKDGDEQNATGIKPCNHAHAPHDLTHKRGKTSSTIHDHHKQNLKRAVSPFKPCRKATMAKLEYSQATITSRTKYHENNEERRSRIIWKLMMSLHELEVQGGVKLHLKARETWANSKGEKQELEWRESKKMRTCKEDRRIEEDRVAKVKLVEELRACSNREPGGAVERWICAQRVYT